MHPGSGTDPVDERPPETAVFSGTAPRAGRRGPVAAIVAGVALVAVAIVTGQAAPTPGPTPRPAASPTAAAATTSPAVTLAPDVGTALLVPARDPAATAVPPPALTPADAGPVDLVATGAPGIRVTVTVPEGWSRAGDAAVVLPDAAGGASVSLSAWVIEDVFAFPCRWASGEVVDPELLATAAGQAEALSAWWGQVPGSPPNTNAAIAPIAIRPTPGSIAGRSAWSVEVLIRRQFEFEVCDGDQLQLWRAVDGTVRATTERGQLHRLWALDLDGRVLVIDATSSTSAAIDDQTALLRVISSMSIEP